MARRGREILSVASVSVVIPTFNRAHLIAETLESVLRQSCRPDEVIVVDDGSTDDTPQAVARFSGRVRLIRIANSGDLVARNTGVAAAAGRLVAFCDSDDLWEPGYLAAMLRIWQQRPDLTATYCNFVTLTGSQRSGRSKFDDAPADFWNEATPLDRSSWLFAAPFVASLIAFQPFFPSAMIVDRGRFSALGMWDAGVSRLVGCDFATMLRVAAAPPVAACRTPLVTIRKHAANFSGDTERMNLGDATVLEYVLATRPELAPLRATILASIAQRRVAALESAFARGDLQGVREISGRLGRTRLSARVRAKVAIARMPRRIGRYLQTALASP
jgi:glycosyltransferase involved in cell wall biosynthesis